MGWAYHSLDETCACLVDTGNLCVHTGRRILAHLMSVAVETSYLSSVIVVLEFSKLKAIMFSFLMMEALYLLQLA